jgi:hypothetical protein
MTRFLSTSLIVAGALLVSAGVLRAQQFPGLRLQGTLSDTSGNPMSGPVTITVLIYSAPTGGTPLFTETFALEVTAGVIDLIMGIGTGSTTGDLEGALLPGSDESGPIGRYLALMVEGERQERAPRQQITGGAYSAVSMNTLRLGGLPPEAYATANDFATLRQELNAVSATLTRICLRVPILCHDLGR